MSNDCGSCKFFQFKKPKSARVLPSEATLADVVERQVESRHREGICGYTKTDTMPEWGCSFYKARRGMGSGNPKHKTLY